jgi:hypothetical protein
VPQNVATLSPINVASAKANDPLYLGEIRPRTDKLPENHTGIPCVVRDDRAGVEGSVVRAAIPASYRVCAPVRRIRVTS